MASKLFGAETILIGKDGTFEASALEGKTLGIYFSAHWCPPCKMFTPMLGEWYNNFKATSPHKDEFEVVFCSSDHDKQSFEEYHKEMPFPALSYDARQVKAMLSEKFGVQGIPTFVIVGADGKLITKNGRSVVMEDPKGEEFPWAPKPFGEVIKGKLVNSQGESFDAAEALKDKYTAIYFSASWCGPCRAFSPQLTKTYNKVKAEGKPFELVFVSADRLEKDHKEYFAKMPWLALPFKDKRTGKLNSMFDVEGIPTLIIVGPDGKVVNKDGREAIGDDPEGQEFPWVPKPIVKLTESSVGRVNGQPVFLHYAKDADAALAALTPVAEAEAEAAKKEDRDAVLFMIASDDDVGNMVRDFARLGDAEPMNALLNIPGQSKYVHSDGTLSGDTAKDLIAKLNAGTLEVQKLR
jgi:nucleoredoxin